MKRILMLALVLTTIATTSFANGSDDISRHALSSFKKAFSTATNVKWETVAPYLKATFTVDGQQMYAYYAETGEQLALTRNLTTSQLSMGLAADLKFRMKNRWLTELFELSSNGETAYFATLYSADEIVVLKSAQSGSWTVFKKMRRTAK